MATFEQRLERLEKSQKRYRFATIGLLCLMVAGVSMGQMNGVEDIVCRSLRVVSVDGKTVANMGEFTEGGGFVSTYSPSGKDLVRLGATVKGGSVTTYSPSGKELVALAATVDGEGFVLTYSPSGKELVRLGSTGNGGSVTTYSQSNKELLRLGATDNGGGIAVYNKTGERIITLAADDYGNGVVGAWNRKGKGRHGRMDVFNRNQTKGRTYDSEY